MNKLNQIISTTTSRSGIVFFSWSVFAYALVLGKDALLANQMGIGSELDAYYLTILIPVFFAQVLGTPISEMMKTEIADADGGIRRKEAKSFLYFFLRCLGFAVPVLLAVVWLYFNVLGPELQVPAIHSVMLLVFVVLILVLQCTNAFLVALKELAGNDTISNFRTMWISVSLAIMLMVWPSYKGLVLAFAIGNLAFFLMMYVSTIGLLTEILATENSAKFSKDQRKKYWFLALTGGLGGSAFFVDQVMAAAFTEGGITTLQYAYSLTSIFAVLGAMSVGSILLPRFNEILGQDFTRDTWKVLQRTMLLVMAIGCAIAGFLYFTAVDLIYALFKHGEFTGKNAFAVADILVAYAGYVPIYVMYFALVTYVSSIKQNNLLIFLSIFSLVANVTLNVLFIQIWGLPGIAWSTVASGVATLIYGAILLRRSLHS